MSVDNFSRGGGEGGLVSWHALFPIFSSSVHKLPSAAEVAEAAKLSNMRSLMSQPLLYFVGFMFGLMLGCILPLNRFVTYSTTPRPIGWGGGRNGGESAHEQQPPGAGEERGQGTPVRQRRRGRGRAREDALKAASDPADAGRGFIF